MFLRLLDCVSVRMAYVEIGLSKCCWWYTEVDTSSSKTLSTSEHLSSFIQRRILVVSCLQSLL